MAGGLCRCPGRESGRRVPVGSAGLAGRLAKQGGGVELPDRHRARLDADPLLDQQVDEPRPIHQANGRLAARRGLRDRVLSEVARRDDDPVLIDVERPAELTNDAAIDVALRAFTAGWDDVIEDVRMAETGAGRRLDDPGR